MATIGRTLGCLGAQTAAQRIEVLVVTPSASEIDRDALGAARFAALRTIEVGPITKRGHAAAAGIHEATAPVVCLLEDHSYPEPEWAAALLKAHAQPWAGVGPCVENANAGTAISRVTFWFSFPGMSGPQEAGPRTLIPWHNTAYKRDILVGYGARLGELLQWEGNLQADLLARGHQLYLEPAARTHHLQGTAFRAALGIHFQCGRILGGLRAETARWPWWRRAAYAAAMPLFPLVKFRQTAPEIRHMGVTTPDIVAAGPALVTMLTAMAVGEAFGYLTGVGDATDRLQDYDLHRTAHLSRRERRAGAAMAQTTDAMAARRRSLPG
jgi:hypothetical protein